MFLCLASIVEPSGIQDVKRGYMLSSNQNSIQFKYTSYYHYLLTILLFKHTTYHNTILQIYACHHDRHYTNEDKSHHCYAQRPHYTLLYHTILPQ